eukprot:COSAG01_NODE_1696_length_9461_cov_8.289010_2_plen_101_part_00
MQATDKQRYDRECLERPNDIPKPRKVTRRKKPAAKVCDASIPHQLELCATPRLDLCLNPERHRVSVAHRQCGRRRGGPGRARATRGGVLPPGILWCMCKD